MARLTIKQVETLANKLINTNFNITSTTGSQQVVNIARQGYTFMWSPKAKRRAGQCHYGNKTIALSKKLIQENLDRPESIEDTIRHEIAHAISYHIYGRRGKGHGYLWKNIAVQVGAKPSRCYDSKKYQPAPSKYTLKCNNCGKTSPRHRKPKHSFSCSPCGNGSYDPKLKLEVIQNY